MMRWVRINQNWILRPTVEGLELISCDGEQVIALALEGSKTDVSECISIFRGEKPFYTQEESLGELLTDLSGRGAITLSKSQPVDLRTKENSKNLKRLWQIRSRLVGSNTPVPKIYWFDPLLSRCSVLGVHLFNAQYTIGGVGTQYETDWSTGISDDLELAELKSIMEALERHASGIIPTSELVRASAYQLGDDVIDPTRLATYTEKQYQGALGLTKFTPDREYFWKEVTTFPGWKRKYLPIDCIYYPIPVEFIPEEPYTLANSSGVASGFSFEEALLRGLYEICERDAFMVVWLNRLVMPKIPIDLLSSRSKERVSAITEFGYTVHLIDLTLDNVPVVLALAVNREKIPALVLGMSANLLNVLSAADKALQEVLQQLWWNFRRDYKVAVLKNPKKVSDVRDHAALYASAKYLSRAEFLWKGEVRTLEATPYPISSLANELERVCSILEQIGSEVIVADLTPSYLRKAGVWVVRAISLGLIPVSFGYGLEPLGMPRIKMLPKRLGLKPKPWRRGKPFTHPYA
jgi:ribosomal protein S12 methylthiotransferase accessory factor